jgi:hypothetical protein
MMAGDRDSFDGDSVKNSRKINLREKPQKTLDYDTLIKNIGFYQR